MEPDKDLYFMLRNAVDLFTRINNRLDVAGEENIPEYGGALVCPSHFNFSDPFFVASGVRNRILHFLAWHGIEEMALVGPVFKKVGVMHAIKESYGVAQDKQEAGQVLGDLEKLLRDGDLVVIFPEGAINHWISPFGNGLKEFKPGALRLAARAGVPIIPVGLKGTRWVVPNIINFHDFGGPDEGFWIPAVLPVKVKVRFGAPFDVDPAAADDRAVAAKEAD
ncbi:MAG TPA: lysophospholipid acyltransferase family protein, partial [bacterium]|nr:lysophospholipid acyltransferase family protein [bacterium]